MPFLHSSIFLKLIYKVVVFWCNCGFCSIMFDGSPCFDVLISNRMHYKNDCDTASIGTGWKSWQIVFCP